MKFMKDKILKTKHGGGWGGGEKRQALGDLMDCVGGWSGIKWR